MLPAFSEHAAALGPGIYQHYSGKQYEVLGAARHSESLEELVIYRALYAPYNFWVRPLGMFLEHIAYNGQLIPRFSYVKPQLNPHVNPGCSHSTKTKDQSRST